MNHLDLFAGIGGFSLGLEMAGDFNTVGFVERDKYCQKALKKHWPDIPIFDDITTFNRNKLNEPVDIITGGFPCQPFSCAGKRKGKDDDRAIWPEMLRVISEFKPAWVIGENVTGIVSMELDNVLASLEDEGYQTQTFIIPACAVNAPHRRERVWIVAHNTKAGEITFQRDFSRNQEIPEKWEGPGLLHKFNGHFQIENWMEVAARLRGVDDGVSSRMDENRLAALGNAVVPQIVCEIGKTILSTYGNNND